MRIVALALVAFLLAPVHTPVEDAAMITVEGDGAKYWPRWRGPSGQGLAVGKGYVDKWSDTENVKWKTKLETTGNGSPIVWANRIFLTTASADGVRRGIAAFDRSTGKKLWETMSRSLANANPKGSTPDDGSLRKLLRVPFPSTSKRSIKLVARSVTIT